MACYHTLQNQVIFSGFLFFSFLCVAGFEYDKIELTLNKKKQKKTKTQQKKGAIVTDVTDSLNSYRIKRFIKFACI